MTLRRVSFWRGRAEPRNGCAASLLPSRPEPRAWKRVPRSATPKPSRASKLESVRAQRRWRRLVAMIQAVRAEAAMEPRRGPMGKSMEAMSRPVSLIRLLTAP